MTNSQRRGSIFAGCTGLWFLACLLGTELSICYSIAPHVEQLMWTGIAWALVPPLIALALLYFIGPRLVARFRNRHT